MEISDGAVRILAGLLEARTGQQLAIGRRWRIDTALRPLIAKHDIPTLDDLVHRIVSGRNAALADEAIEALLNHETFFYRDLNAFRLLDEQGLERMRAARAGTRRLRIWSAGCSTGQEAYTIAMMIAERPDRWRGWTIDILGTDLSPTAIERAKEGRYSQFEIQRGLPVAQMLRRFDQDGGYWQASPLLRQAVRFRVHNLLTPPPVGLFDVVLCRNVLLYFSPDVRTLVFSRIASAMQADAVLMLGAGETAMGQTDAFVSDFEARGLYRKRIDASSVAVLR
ncbi:CheR family methyltransferase [Sphingomonas oryzagri]|uniref:Protein-glutamate O-methyltransferase CheR n=1 Tax=Sphingomonas oryzagri TaxID=3042314 RepID=A0ABT6N099_9SPHN|nr:protein-glutamate O-methyltransferase CheR [Sphingomonas oryzagri]MDH7638518.1 protein-glutamate O-methyltransferase CheR [Sphingomonas oryzagri]